MAVEVPSHRVLVDVLPNTAQRHFVANYMFIVITLPNLVGIAVSAEPFGHADFKAANDRTNRFGRRPNGIARRLIA